MRNAYHHATNINAMGTVDAKYTVGIMYGWRSLTSSSDDIIAILPCGWFHAHAGGERVDGSDCSAAYTSSPHLR